MGTKDEYDSSRQDEDDCAGSEGSVDGESNANCPKFITAFAQIKKPITVEVGHVTEFVPRWTRTHAFREVYQNWRDAMLQSNNIPLRRLVLKDSKHARRISVEAFHPDSGERLGYIKFTHNEEGYGKLEITNFRASLEYRHLKTGATTKIGHNDQAGGHGEGLKIAALIFHRSPNNHDFRIESSGINLTFKFNTGLHLACSMRRMRPKKLDGLAKSKRDAKPNSLKADPSKDTSVIIGEKPDRGKETLNSKGSKTLCKQVHIEDVRRWFKVTLDINPPTDIVRTDCGDIIMDPAYKNHLYLLGLRLVSGSMSGKRNRYGYNFSSGETNRDREAVSTPGQEAQKIVAIWAAAILENGEKSAELLAIWTDMLMNALGKVGDVALTEYEEWLGPELIERVWAYMRTIKKGDDGRDAFYYTPGDGKDMAHIITHSLKQHPVPLSADFWEILRWFELPRTPQEEQQRRFSRVAVVDTPADVFSKNMEWMLQCCIQSHPDGNSMNFEFVDGKDLSIDTAFLRPTWKIHNRWLTFEEAHKGTFCEQHCPKDEDPFCCDHAVLSLWNGMLSQLVALDETCLTGRDIAYFKSKAAARISQMPRGVRCFRNEKKGQLVVTWISVDSHRNRHMAVRVILHSDGCTNEPITSWDHPRNIMFNPLEQERACDCPSQTSEMASLAITFEGLNPTMRYFPSVSRDIEGAFVGRHPPSIRPLQEDLVIKPEPAETAITNTHVSSDLIPGGGVSSAESLDRQSLCAARATESSNDGDSMSLYADPAKATSSSMLSGARVRGQCSADKPNSMSTQKSHYASLGDRPLPTSVRKNENHPKSTAVSETYTIGEEVDIQNLPWNKGFPASHGFYRTVSRPEKDIFIAKPRMQRLNQNGKRPQNERAESRFSKQPRAELKNDEQPSRQSRTSRSDPSTRQTHKEMASRGLNPSPSPATARPVQQLSSSQTPGPPGGIIYRY